MRNTLAERLLGTVLEWSDEKLTNERPILVSLARLKYDEYNQFTPGMKFIESLACWLKQFSSLEEREVAYEFIRNRLLFFSNSEVNHLVDVTYHSIIRPVLLSLVSKQTGIPLWKVNELSESEEYKELNIRSLFLGLSDGARIDRFRRTNNKEISNEQILPYYDLSDEKIQSLRDDLKATLAKSRNKKITEISDQETTFKLIFLLDDFSASGFSMLRLEKDKYKGKLVKIQNLIRGTLSDKQAIDQEECKVYSVIYVMTEKAIDYLKNLLLKYWNDKCSCTIKPVLILRNDIVFGTHLKDHNFKKIIDSYYDEEIMDSHLRKGGTEDVKLGFAACGLPLVLSHNTPNDSIFLLWSYTKTRGLFPRTSRHKES